MLRRRLTFPAAAIALALSVVLIGLGIARGHVIVSIMSDQLIRQMAEAIRRDVDVIVRNAEGTLTRAVNSIARHDVPLSDPAALRRELYGLLRDEPYVDWLFCGNEAGGAVDAGRLADGTLVFLMTDNFRAGVMREYEASPDGRLGTLRKSGVEFDTRKKPWYTRAKDTRARYWTEPFLGSAEPILGMALSVPVFTKDGGFAGVCGLDLILTSLSRLMASLHLGDNGRAFIIDDTGHLIASSGGVVPVVTGADGKEARLLASEAGDPVVRETARDLGRHPDIVGPSSTTGLQVFSFDDPRQGRIHAAADCFEAPGGIAWTIVAALPASDFFGPVQRAAYYSIAIATFVVAVSLVLGLWAVRRTLQPMTALTEAAQAIAKGEWRDVPEVRRTDEIGLLAQAFILMTARLKDTLDGLRRSEQSYRTIFESALEGIARTSVDGKILAANPAAARIFGYASPDEMMADFRLTYVREHERDAVMAALSTKGAIVGYEVEFYRQDGQRIWVAFSSRMARDVSGGEVFVESFITDVTERKRAEDALRQAQAELAHATRVATLGELTASIVHEINQPLGAVVNNASACLRWLTGQNLEEARQSAARVVADGHRASEIVGRIRALAKKSPLRKDWLDINETICEVIVLVQSEIRANRVSLQTHLAEGLPPVWGDRIQLQQVVLNLLMNAVEAMKRVSEGPRELWVGTEQGDSPGMVIAVRDSGPGVDPHSRDRLFDAFYTTKPEGLGMGLAICRSIVESHGGRLWATANVPRGAVFQFTLPMGREGAA